jgi:hypothetical protein
MISREGINMIYHKDIVRFIDNVISDYAKYDHDAEQDVLDAQDLPDSVRQEFSALILSFNGAEVSDTLGVNNPKFEKYVVPAVIAHLKEPWDKDLRSELLDQLRESIIDYHLDILQQYLQDRLENHNKVDNYREKYDEQRGAYV